MTDDNYEYVFGFGSIMNSSTHAPWLENSSSSSLGSNKTLVHKLPGLVVRIKPEFGYERNWNFRSTTGFTALGVSRCNFDSADVASGGTNVHNNHYQSSGGGGMNGVIFQIPSALMPGFDRREVGYDKIQIPLQFIDQDYCHQMKQQQQQSTSSSTAAVPFQLTANDKIWIYVPQSSQCREADENHPLLQSYVDTVLQGCLEWGGEPMAQDFVLSTGGWSPYFLNDTPNSRRPWLFRKDYDTIDSILKRHSTRTRYADRRHPEEFASTFLIRRMRGTWSIPRRNRHFTGRDHELGQIHRRLQQQHQQDNDSSMFTSSNGSSGSVNFLFVQGMGGVGKSSICTEYCYRHFPASYGLVIWLNAESAENLVADYRQLLGDLADGADATSSSGSKDATTTDNNSTEEVIGEVKTRLFRCQVPWLLVFDNLEDRSLLDKFVPRGAASQGHVLVTSRVVDMESGFGLSSLVLGCLSPAESIEMLRRALGQGGLCSENDNDKGPNSQVTAATEICERLGYLPLALGMAAAYMQRCDVSCIEYVERYVRSEQAGRSLLRHQAGRLHDYSLSVSASLSLSLNAIEKENQTASALLRLLCWLGPDQITKALLRALLSTKTRVCEERKVRGGKLANSWQFYRIIPVSTGSLVVVFGLVVGGLVFGNRNRTARYGASIVALSSVAGLAALTIKQQTESHMSPPSRRNSGARLGADEFEQSDLVWNILKSYSILTVKEGKGNMHRLLAQSLRTAQEDDERCHNLEICVQSMALIWKFQPNDSKTWSGSLNVLEHVKSLVSHVAEHEHDICPSIILKAGVLSIEAGVFSAMALNGFIEAQASLELSLKILGKFTMKQKPSVERKLVMEAKAEAQHELGRVLRYQGNFCASEQTLLDALYLRQELAKQALSFNSAVANTLHELGVLEVKKHSLDTAEEYLTKALALRRSLDEQCGDINADCAATLHQIAAVKVARKPPLLEQAEELLQEALKHSRQIGQRAATLKQLARVTIRQGLLDTAEVYLRRALEMYQELYGERAMHINIAGVKFQQGALACQREQLEQAWIHFSECLRIRRHVYAYARPLSDGGDTTPDPLHLEVSCVLHELGCVAHAQMRYSQSLQMLQAERCILEKLHMEDLSSQSERLFQARLTNLTWLKKSAKEMGDEEAAALFTSERAELKNEAKRKSKVVGESENTTDSATLALQMEAIHCRLAARQYALAKRGNTAKERDLVAKKLSRLLRDVNRAPPGTLKEASKNFHDCVARCIQSSNESMQRSSILQACDTLRDTLRAHGVQVHDAFTAS